MGRSPNPLEKCLGCDADFKPLRKHIKVEENLYEVQFLDRCSFCRRREKEIVKIKQQITDLEFRLYCMGA